MIWMGGGGSRYPCHSSMNAWLSGIFLLGVRRPSRTSAVSFYPLFFFIWSEEPGVISQWGPPIFLTRAVWHGQIGRDTTTARQERRLKSSSEKALGRDYGDLKPLLPPRLLPMVFRGGRERNEDSPSVHPAPHLSLPFYTVAPIRPVCVRARVHVREWKESIPFVSA